MDRLFVHVNLCLDDQIKVISDWTFTNDSFFLLFDRCFYDILFRFFYSFLIFNSCFCSFCLRLTFCLLLTLIFLHLLLSLVFCTLVFIIDRDMLLALLVKVIQIFLCVQICKLCLSGSLLILISTALHLALRYIVHIIYVNSWTNLKSIYIHVCFLCVFETIPLVNLHKHKCLIQNLII